MERIQNAIAKARATRSTGAARPEGMPAPPTSVPMQPEAMAEAAARDEAWALLTPLTLSHSHLTKRRIVTVNGGHEASHFDAMRTKVIQAMRANGWKRLAITSPTAGCGKSTIAANLAFSLGRQADLRTILAEIDFRRPSMSKTLGFSSKGDLSAVLEGKIGFGAAASRYGYNLALATNTRPVRDAAELLQSPLTAANLTEIESQYAPDLMLFDMPPMLLTDDAMAFAGQVDCVLLVAAAESTTVKEIDSCEREIASQTNVLGVVLNKCRYMGPEYGYGYYG